MDGPAVEMNKLFWMLAKLTKGQILYYTKLALEEELTELALKDQLTELVLEEHLIQLETAEQLSKLALVKNVY